MLLPSVIFPQNCYVHNHNLLLGFQWYGVV